MHHILGQIDFQYELYVHFQKQLQCFKNITINGMKNSMVFHKNQNYTIHNPCANAMEQHKNYTGSKLASSALLEMPLPPHPKFKPNKSFSLIHTVIVLTESFCIICM